MKLTDWNEVATRLTAYEVAYGALGLIFGAVTLSCFYEAGRLRDLKDWVAPK